MNSSAVGYFLEKEIDDMVIIATDAGSAKKAYKYSQFFKCPMAMVDKRREGNKDKAISTTIIGLYSLLMLFLLHL